MHPQISQFALLLIITLISFSLPPTYSQYFTNCSGLYSCGESIKQVGYPFWGQGRAPECGFQGLELICQDNQTTIEINNRTFRVLEIIPNSHLITVARNDLWENLCPRELLNTTLNDTLYAYDHDTDKFLDFYYSCSSNVGVSDRNNFSCNTDGRERIVFYLERSSSSTSLQTCEVNITVPVFRSDWDDYLNKEALSLSELINKGFQLEYKVNHSACTACQNSRGVCWSETNTSKPTCLCKEGVSDFVCHDGGSITFSVKIIIGMVCGGAAMVCLAISIVIYFNYKRSAFIESLAFWKPRTQNDKNIELFISQYGFSNPKRYKFFEIKKMTNSFKDELGQGGFGSVYKGKLVDGTLVAVKVLKESKGNGEDFIKEVASIGKTSHINIVSLLGFCYEGQKRALIYEFMPNGSLEKFIYHSNKSTDSIANHLGGEKLFEIAVGIARGLEYLHRGCSTRILHFDIKPHNILLDEDFCPKISDFGLAKLYSRKESVISSVEARGTIGYTAPEVFNRSFGGVSHKSDVYSYGMMVLEMVGGRKNLDIHENGSKIYFPQWIYKKIELDDHVEIPVVENETARKMIIVGLWCIQTNPSERPSMNKVIEMLEGSMEGLRIPPNPFFPSPESSPLSSFTTLETISLIP